MEKTQNLLENHVIYGLDCAICDYLIPVLEQKLGKPFRIWRFLLQEQSIRSADATRALGIAKGQPEGCPFYIRIFAESLGGAAL